MLDWKIEEYPGFLGKKRAETEAKWDALCGDGTWKIAYRWGDEIIPRFMAIQLYDDSYVHHFQRHPEDLIWLVETASDVYDTDPSNVHSGLDYTIQETLGNHLQDIAIRRALVRLGERFRGDHLVQVRWKDTEGFKLNPGVVPFHMPEMIV